MPTRGPTVPLHSYRRVVAAGAFSVVAIVGGVMGAAQYRLNAHTRQQTINVALTQSANRVNARIGQLLRAAEMTAESGARRTVGRAVLGTELLPLFTDVVSAFEQRPELTYLGYAIAATGEYALLERRPDGSLVLREYRGVPGPSRLVTDFRWANGAFVRVAESRGDIYDPRTRPHYLAVQKSRRPQWTELYPFVRRFTSDVKNGTTFALPSLDANGALVGVWDASFDLLALSDFVRQLRTETGASTFLYERRQTLLQPLAGIDQPPSNDAVSAEQALLSGAVVDSVQRRATGGAGDSSSAPVLLLDRLGNRQYVAVRALRNADWPRWVVAVAVPQAIVEAPLDAVSKGLALTTAAILALATLLSLLAGRWLARPLEELGAAADAISRGAALPPESLRPQTREVAAVRGSFKAMSEAITLREAALRAGAQRLQSHFDNTPLGVVEFNPRFVITSWNAAASSIFGWTRDEMVGGDGYRLVPGHLRGELFDACEQVLASGSPSRYHLEHIRRDGALSWCDWYVTPTKSDDGTVTGVSALVLDVSQRLGAEDAFRQAEERFAILFAAIPVPAAITRTADGVMLDVNAAAASLFEFKREDMLGRSGLMLNLWEDVATRNRAVERLNSGVATHDELVNLRTKSGGSRRLLYSVVPVTLGGEPCGLWVCLDLTERENMFAQLSAAHALKTSIVDAAHDAILVIDDAAHVIEWNESASRLLGRPRGDALGRSIVDVLNVQESSPDMRGALADSLRALARAPVDSAPTELTLRCGNGELLHVDLTVVSTTTAAGAAFTIAIADRTARRLLTLERAAQQTELTRLVAQRTGELTRANARLQEVDQLKNRFLATVSHELRTPLTSILGYAELLQGSSETRNPLSTLQSQQVGYVRAAATDLLRLINDLLDLSRIESGRLSLTVEVVDIAAVLAAIEATVAPEVARKQLSYFTIIDPSVARSVITSDRHRLQQVLLNVVSNAVKFTSAGTVRVHASAADDGGVSIAVDDTGPGIADALRAQLFQPFSSLDTDPSSRARGTGLGLYLVKRLLNLLGGRVTLESRTGKGTCFTIWFPDTVREAPERALFESSWAS